MNTPGGNVASRHCYAVAVCWASVHTVMYEVDPGKSGLRLGQAVRAEGSASDVRVVAVRLVYM